jgi:hypothetical protein
MDAVEPLPEPPAEAAEPIAVQETAAEILPEEVKQTPAQKPKTRRRKTASTASAKSGKGEKRKTKPAKEKTKESPKPPRVN